MDTRSVEQAFAEAIRKGIFSGAQLLVGKDRERRFFQSYGTHRFTPDAPAVQADSLFDVASLTKPVATVTLLAMALEEGRIRLEDPVKKYLSTFDRPEEITLEHLLAHHSGLPAWLPLFKEFSSGVVSYPQVRDRILHRINQVPLTAGVGEKRIYSDLGFILLGFVLEGLESKRLDVLFRERIALPLKLKRTRFNPLLSPTKIPPKEIVSTEDSPRRKKILTGEVHDDNAHVLGGVAGHAGLFSTAYDLESFVHFIWSAEAGQNSLLRRETLLRFIGRSRPYPLGWDTVSPEESQAGKYFSQGSFGHLAFTGCSLWLDPSDRKYVILLTNRVHPSRENEAIKNFRPRIHDLILESTGLVPSP